MSLFIHFLFAKVILPYPPKGVSFKWSKQKFVCGKIMVKRKITAKLAVIFLKNGGPNRDRTDDLTDANELKALICIDFQTFPALSAGM